MSSNRVPLVVGALVAAFIVARQIAIAIFNAISLLLTPGFANASQLLRGEFDPGTLVPDVLAAVAFGAGVWVSLRWVAPINFEIGWRKTAARGLIAAALGSAGEAVWATAVSLVLSANPGTYPFGYSLSPTLNAASAASEISGDLFSAVFEFLDYVAVVVLAVVLLKVWMRWKLDEVTAPASLFAKL